MSIEYTYYERQACPHCQREYDGLKIGTSGFGWNFAVNVYPDKGIHRLRDWGRLFDKPGSLIKDESGDVLSAIDMLWIITVRQGPGGRPPKAFKSGDPGFVAPGAGSWDYFSSRVSFEPWK